MLYGKAVSSCSFYQGGHALQYTHDTCGDRKYSTCLLVSNEKESGAQSRSGLGAIFGGTDDLPNWINPVYQGFKGMFQEPILTPAGISAKGLWSASLLLLSQNRRRHAVQAI